MKNGIALIVSLLLVACGQGQDPVEATAGAVGETTEFEWISQGTPAGSTTVTRTGDGKVTVKSFVHWNNREYSVDSEVQYNADGIPVAQRITGISAFGAPIDESFTFADGVASWSTAGESGSVNTDEPAFYVATEFGAMGMTELVRAAVRNMDGEIAVFPVGTVRVEAITSTDVETPDGTQELTMYALHGLSFTPFYLWFNEDLELTVIDMAGWMGMYPKGWSTDVLDKLSSIQIQEDAAMVESMAGDLAIELDKPLVIDEVDVVDVENGVLLENQYVTVENGKIKSIESTVQELEDVIRIDGAGKTLIPGMWDMHGHFGLSDGVLNIAGGVTSVRDVGSVHEQIIEMTAKYDSGEVIGPNTYRSGFIDQASPFATGDTVKSLEEALDRIDFYAANGYMQIKLYSSINPEWVDEIAERTHKHGMRLSGHIPAFMSAEQAVRAGYDEIQHINMVFLNFLAGDREDTRKQLRFTLYGDKAGELDLDSSEVNDFVALLKENDVTVDLTSAIFMEQLTHHVGDPNPTFAPVIDHLPVNIARGYYKVDMDMGDMVAEWTASAVAQAAMTKKLHDSGVQIVPGSDNVAGFTIHRELELYAEAGISNADVLRIASLDSARICGVDDRTGSITVGKDADLVLVEGNPLEDMSAIRNATLVLKGGNAYQPDQLYKAVGVKPFVASESIPST